MIKQNLENGFKSYKKFLELKIDFSKQQKLINNIFLFLDKILKKKYKYIINYENLKLYYQLDSNYDIINLSISCYTYDSALNKLNLYGIKVEKDFIFNKYKYTQFNIVKDIPNALKNQSDYDLLECSNKIDEINKIILIEIDKILNKENFYNKIIKNKKDIQKSQNNLQKILNENLKESDFLKKTKKKIKEFYREEPLLLYFSNSKIGYNNYSISLFAEIDNNYEKNLNFKQDCFNSTHIYIGKLSYNKEKWKFEPNFKNQEYFISKITSLKYMRRNFLNHIKKNILKEI